MSVLFFTNGSVARIEQDHPVIQAIRDKGFDTQFLHDVETVVNSNPTHVVATELAGLESLFTGKARIFLWIHNPDEQRGDIQQAMRMKSSVKVTRSLMDLASYL